MTRCIGLIGYLFGHHYVTAYSVSERPNENCQGVKMSKFTEEMLKAVVTLTDKSPVSIYCIRCGHKLPLTEVTP